MKIIVSTSRKSSFNEMTMAKKIASELRVPYVNRKDFSRTSMIEYSGLDGMIVVEKENIVYVAQGQELFFHPGLAKLRIIGINNGKTDQMIEAMSLEKGDTVLDCTLGLGTDAVVASYVAGPEGMVTGLERSPVIALIVRYGLKRYHDKDKGLLMAMAGVKVHQACYRDYLLKLEDNSFDVVYFDPMFRSPRLDSPSINAIRGLAIKDPVASEILDRAKRVARKRVVMKERRGSSEFDRLGFERINGGKYATVAYGVFNRKGSHA